MSRFVALAWRPFALLLFFGIFASFFFAAQPVAAASCATSGPTSGAYSVTVCITSPTGGSTLSGNNTVGVSVSVTGTNPGVQRVIYSMDSAYLITDFQSPYSFTLPTANYVDGSHTLQAQALMRDGFMTAAASSALTFSNGVTSPPTNNKTFTPALGTSPAAGQPFVVAAVGDGAGGEANEAKVVSLISSWNPNLFLYLGDVYENGSPLEFYNWYDPSNFYGVFRAITDPTIGNHEYTKGVAAGYFNYWNNVPNYYSYNAGGWHFISLNSTSQFNQYSTSSPQYQWLQKDLAANATACTVAYYHHPLYNVGSEGATTAMSPIWSLLYSYGVTLVLNGHDHDYQRWVPLDGSGSPASNGITEIVDGTGGHGIQKFVTTDSRLAVGYDTTSAFGALRLQLGSTSANFAFINTAGTTLDSGTLPCHGAPAPTNTPTPTPTLAPAPTNTPTLAPTPTTAPAPTNTPAPAPTNTPILAPTPTNTAAPTPTSSAAAITLNPIADAYVSSAYPTTNYNNTTLRVDASPVMNSYLRFSVSGLAGTVKAVTLQIYANSNLTAGYEVHGVADNTWGETTITYSNAPAFGNIINTSGAVTTGTWVSVDVTSYVTGNGTFSFGLRTSSTTQLSLASRESTNPPRLVITTQ